MSFRFYSNAISQASKSLATGIFIVGLLLIGFAVIIAALPEIFAYLAAAVFFVAGIGSCVTAVKIFLAQRKLDKITSEEPPDYRENVHIHIEEHHGE
ncbi:MAG: hypothetical protein ACYSU3_05045 [Planctomycetota bacterium]|jgi:hypothetical protein